MQLYLLETVANNERNAPKQTIYFFRSGTDLLFFFWFLSQGHYIKDVGVASTHFVTSFVLTFLYNYEPLFTGNGSKQWKIHRLFILSIRNWCHIATNLVLLLVLVTRPLSVHQKCRLDTKKKNLIFSDVEKRPTNNDDDVQRSSCIIASSYLLTCLLRWRIVYAHDPLHTFPRNFSVDGEVANLLRTC